MGAARLQRTVALAARTLGFPMGMVTILDSTTQHTISSIGMDAPAAQPRAGTICDRVVATGQVVVIDDASVDPRTRDFYSAAQNAVRGCLAVPLTGRESIVVGSLCLQDVHARRLGAEQIARLTDFGRIIDDQLDLMRRLHGHRNHGPAKTHELAAAVANGEIVPWYQPVVDLRTSNIIGYEALARWQRITGAVDLPDGFIPLAEDSELIVDLDLAMFRSVLRDVKVWPSIDPMATVSINVSGRSLAREGFAEQLHTLASEVGVEPASVLLEITESARLTGNWDVDASVARLRRGGFGLLLDDFGTGWSSLEYILRLPINGVKIDRAVTAALGTPVGDALVRSVTGLAHRLHVTTTIEGIESSEQADLALALGCDYGQGFHWSRAVPAEIARATMRGTVRRSRADGPATTGPSAADAWAADQPSGGASAWVSAAPAVSSIVARDILDALPDATAILDSQATIVAVNRAWRMFALDNGGEDSGTGVGANYLSVCDESAGYFCPEAAVVADHLRAVLNGAVADAEVEYLCSSPGIIRWFLVRVSPIQQPVEGVIVSHINITRRKMAEDEHAHAASHDPLTGLVNRTLFAARLRSALKARSAPSAPSTVGLVYIDLNRFKSINDTFGHAAGDEVLLTSALWLRNAIRPGDTVARLGGDEFAVIAPRIDSAALGDLGRRIQLSLSGPHQIHGQTVTVRGSIGTYLAAPGDDPAEALARADTAMYRAKAAGDGLALGS